MTESRGRHFHMKEERKSSYIYRNLCEMPTETESNITYSGNCYWNIMLFL